MQEKKGGTAAEGAASNPQPAGGTPPTQTAAPQNPLGAAVSVPSTPPAPVAPLSPIPAPKEKNMGEDIAKILHDSKLPERHDTALGGERAARKEVRDIDTLLRARTDSPTQPLNTVPAPVSTSATSSSEKTSVQSLHTLKQDLQHVVTEQKISVVRAVALEEDRHASRAEMDPIGPAHPQSNRAKNVLFAAALLLFLGVAAFGGVYVVMMDRAETFPNPISDSLVFAERTVTLELDDQSPTQLKNLLQGARTASAASIGSITRIVPVKLGEIGTRPATLPEFLRAIGAQPPDQLMRALSSEYFFGLHTIDKNAPVLVIPVVSYDNAFAGMLAWEDRLNADLAPVYAGVPMLIAGADGIPQRRAFVDSVMRNYDVRQLTDDGGAIVLYYAFPTRNMLIIAESPYTFTELLARLQAQRNL